MCRATNPKIQAQNGILPDDIALDISYLFYIIIHACTLLSGERSINPSVFEFPTGV
jgi:hypothetical protein